MVPRLLLPFPGDGWTDAPEHAPRSPSYAGKVQRSAFADWILAKRKQFPMSRKELARKVWPESAESATTSQIKRYETVERDAGGRPTRVILPSPGTLRRICRALDISFLEAFTLAGYYHETLEVLADLVDLGKRWLSEDHAFAHEGTARVFRSHGVVQLNGKPVWEALREERYASRYTIGSWEDAIEPPPASDYDGADPKLAAFMQRRPNKISCVVPKPLAVAILVAMTGFPRRGDVYKDDVSAYGAHLLSKATWLAELAQTSKRKRGSLPFLMRKADDVLKEPALPIDTKRVIAAEYLVEWADKECNMYAHIARLGAYAYFGEAGSSVSTLTAYERLPQLRRSMLPDLAEFSNLQM